MTISPLALALIIILGLVCLTLIAILRWREQQEGYVPPRPVETSARSKPLPVETEAAPGGTPGAERAWSNPPAPGAVHGRHAAGTPRLIDAQQHDAWEATQVISAENEKQRIAEAAWRNDVQTIDRVAKRLKALSVPAPTLVDVAGQYHSMPGFGQAPVARILGQADLGQADKLGRTLAERWIS